MNVSWWNNIIIDIVDVIDVWWAWWAGWAWLLHRRVCLDRGIRLHRWISWSLHGRVRFLDLVVFLDAFEASIEAALKDKEIFLLILVKVVLSASRFIVSERYLEVWIFYFNHRTFNIGSIINYCRWSTGHLREGTKVIDTYWGRFSNAVDCVFEWLYSVKELWLPLHTKTCSCSLCTSSTRFLSQVSIEQCISRWHGRTLHVWRYQVIEYHRTFKAAYFLIRDERRVVVVPLDYRIACWRTSRWRQLDVFFIQSLLLIFTSLHTDAWIN